MIIFLLQSQEEPNDFKVPEVPSSKGPPPPGFKEPPPPTGQKGPPPPGFKGPPPPGYKGTEPATKKPKIGTESAFSKIVKYIFSYFFLTRKVYEDYFFQRFVYEKDLKWPLK